MMKVLKSIFSALRRWGFPLAFVAMTGAFAFYLFTMIEKNDSSVEASRSESKRLALQKSEQSLDALQKFQEQIQTLLSFVNYHLAQEKDLDEKEYEDLKDRLGSYEKKYSEGEPLSAKREDFLKSLAFLRTKIENMTLALIGMADHRRMARRHFEETGEKFLKGVSDAQGIAQWRAQMAMRRSSISQESGLKIELEETMPVLNTLAEIQKQARDAFQYVGSYLADPNREHQERFKRALERIDLFIQEYEGLVRRADEKDLTRRLRATVQKLGYWGNFVIQGSEAIQERKRELTHTEREISAVIATAIAHEDMVGKEIYIAENKDFVRLFSMLLGLIALGTLVFVMRNKKPALSEADVSAVTKATHSELKMLEVQLERLRAEIEQGKGARGDRLERKKLAVLIVDKDEAFVRKLSNRFRLFGYKIYRAYDERQAISETLRMKPDVILADLEVCVSDDCELLTKLRQNHPLIPIIVMKTEEEEVERLKWSPVDFEKIVTKTDVQAVVRLVSEVIEEQKAREKVAVAGQRNVLIIDEDETFCETIREALTFWNFNVGVAHSGLEALELLKARPCRLALMDYRLPGRVSERDALETLQSIKQLNPDLMVIIMSAYADRKGFKKLEKMGAYVGLAKPFDLEELHEMVDNFFAYDRPMFDKWFRKAATLYRFIEEDETDEKKSVA